MRNVWMEHIEGEKNGENYDKPQTQKSKDSQTTKRTNKQIGF